MTKNKTERVVDTHQKAHEINLDPKYYGSFAEIGAGQEVVRWFFRAGGAAKTIAKSISAYDMHVSDAIYGSTDRYVCRERLEAMLDHEHTLTLDRLGTVRGQETAFFTFADTVAARSQRVSEYWHGWMAIRFQSRPCDADSQIILHVQMKDTHNALQQEALGIVGVNLIYGACHLFGDPEALMESLLDSLSTERVEIDMIEFSGAAFRQVDNRVMSLKLVVLGLSGAAMFDPSGKVLQPANMMFGKKILVERGRFRPVSNIHLDMLRASREKFAANGDGGEQVLLEIAEITMSNLLVDGGRMVLSDFIERVDLLAAMGKCVLISDFPEYYRLGTYLSQYTAQRIGIAMGVPSLSTLFDEKYYRQLQGGILESFGQLFKNQVTLYIYPYLDPETQRLTTLENLKVPSEVEKLYSYLVERGFIVQLDNFDTRALKSQPGRIIDHIATGNRAWEDSVPPLVAQLIKAQRFFGYGVSI